jgi:hypothetical protein
MSVRHRLTSIRIGLLGGLALSAAACANIWGFADLEDAGEDAGEDVSVLSDATVGATQDAGALANDGAGVGVLDSGTPDTTDGRAANDAHDASIVCPSGYHPCPAVDMQGLSVLQCSTNISPNSCGPSSCLPCVAPLNGLKVDCNGMGCTGTCASTLTLCDGGSPTGQCVDVRTDPNHCGACGTVCRAPNDGGVATCSGALPACGIACNPGLTACPVVTPTGCVDTTRDIRNCGACANACPPHDGGAAASCVDGGCQ